MASFPRRLASTATATTRPAPNPSITQRTVCAPRRTGGRSRAPGPDRESMDLTDYMSDQAEEILQQAARTAAEWGSREVDSEHLLFALADNDVVQAILARFKLSPEELKRQVQEISPRRDRKGKLSQGSQTSPKG